MAENNQEQLLRYLNDAYAMEEGSAESMKDALDDAEDPEVKALLGTLIQADKTHAEQINARIQALGGDKAEAKGIVNTIIGKASHLVNAFHGKQDKQTQDVIKFVAREHFGVGAYLSLKSFSDAIGDTETARLADRIMTEEKQSAERLLALIPRLAAAAVSQE